jgi:FAD/FMN-containing dehydrogenase
VTARIASFGGVTPLRNPDAIGPREALSRFAARDPRPMLPFGNGRSYGDSCLTSVGSHGDMRAMNRILAFDSETGVLTAEPGLLLGELLERLRGLGWFPPVVPGTQHVTLGGALANDIHGKNHHVAGTFGCHIKSFKLARSDGSVITCASDANAALYAATIGGLGLTGIIVEMTLQLMRVPAHDIASRTIAFSGLDGYFDLIDGEGEAATYAVAWIDQLATGRRFGRGLMMLGEHRGDDLPRKAGLKLGVPVQPPVSLLNGMSLAVFNAFYHAAGARKRGVRPASAQAFFFPLDAIANWNRLYGPRGLYQHQSVIPLAAARSVIPEMLAATQAAGEASFLTVLKKFGSRPSPGLMSFPRAGHTLTLDFPNRGRRTLALLERLDAMVVEAGGAINPYKDARMSAATFRACFPQWRELETQRDPAILSDFWTRTALGGGFSR